MKTVELIAKTGNCFGESNVVSLKKYESLEVSFSYLDHSDVLTSSTGTVGDDNVGGFLDAWEE